MRSRMTAAGKLLAQEVARRAKPGSFTAEELETARRQGHEDVLEMLGILTPEQRAAFRARLVKGSDSDDFRTGP